LGVKGRKTSPFQGGEEVSRGFEIKKLYFDDKNNIGLCQ
jgi:hypothetical protein